MPGGEFLQLIASLERQQKAEVDAEYKFVTALTLERKKEEARAHESDLARKHQANMYILNDALAEQRGLEKEVKTLETGLEDLGVVINEYNSLKADDKEGDAAQSILELTYNNDITKLDHNQLASQGVSEKIDSIGTQNSDLEDRITTLKQRKREYDAIDESLTTLSGGLFKQEDAQGFGGDWKIDEREMAKFIAINEKDYNATVAQFGGDEAEVQRRLRSHFGQYTKDQFEVLNTVYAAKSQEANAIISSRKAGLLPPSVQQTAKAMNDQLEDNVKSFNGVVSDMGINYTPSQIEDDPILKWMQGDTVSDRSGLAGSKGYMGGLEARMSGLIKELDSYGVMNQDIPSELRNDKRALSLWYSGQIVRMDDFIKEFPDYKTSSADFTDKSGKKYMYVQEPDIQIDYAFKRVNALDWEDKVGTFTNPENVVYGAISFFNEYSKAHELYDGINDQKTLLLNAVGVTADEVTGDGSRLRTDKNGKPLADNVNRQRDLDETIALQQFGNEFNMDYGVVYKHAREAGLDVFDYMRMYREKASRPTFGMSVSEAEKMYTEEGHFGEDVTATERGVEIIQRLEAIEKGKDKVFEDWLDGGGDAQIQQKNQQWWFDENYMGPGWEQMHEEGADLIDELRQIRDIAAKVGDSGLWDYYLEGTGRETLIEDIDKGTPIRFADGIGLKYRHRSQLDIALEELGQ